MIADVYINGPATLYATEVVALDVFGNGSAFVSASRLWAPMGAVHSVGAQLSDGATIDLANDATLLGGIAGESYGLRDLGTAELVLTGGMLEGGPGTTKSAGIVAGGTGFLGTSITGANVFGGTAPDAYGILQGLSPHLVIQGAVVQGQGSPANSTATVGIAVDQTTSIAISDSQIKGATSPTPSGNPGPTSSIGIRLGQTTPHDAIATITQCDIDGGSLGRFRTGVLSNGVPFTLSDGETAGTHNSVVCSEALGVDIGPAFNPGDIVNISNNTSITGGSAQGSLPDGATGIQLRAPNVSLEVTGNQLIQGSTDATMNASVTGILVSPTLPYGTYVIENNESIIGGPSVGYDAVGVIGYGDISMGNTLLMPFVVQNNALIAGNTTLTATPADAYGMRVRKVNATIQDNDLIFGGYTNSDPTRMVVGLYAGSSAVENISLDVSGNQINGGSGGSTKGLWAVGAAMALHENAIDACGLASPPGVSPAACLAKFSSIGLIMERDKGSSIENNFVFGGYANSAFGCQLGADLTTYFQHNLCFALGGPGTTTRALVLQEFDSAGAAFVRNNIFDGGTNQGNPNLFPWRSAVHFGTFTAAAIEISHNELVLGPACAVTTANQSGACQGTTVATLNGMDGQNGHVINSNVAVPMGYVSPDLLHPTAAGYHLGAACVLQGLALPSSVTIDYDGDPRTLLTIGPDECQ